MKKFLKYVCILVLIISIFLSFIIIISNIITIIRIMFFGMTVGSNEYLDSIWFRQITLKGLSGVRTFYKTGGEIVYIFELPILFISIIYQFIYFKIIRKYK